MSMILFGALAVAAIGVLVLALVNESSKAEDERADNQRAIQVIAALSCERGERLRTDRNTDLAAELKQEGLRSDLAGLPELRLDLAEGSRTYRWPSEGTKWKINLTSMNKSPSRTRMCWDTRASVSLDVAGDCAAGDPDLPARAHVAEDGQHKFGSERGHRSGGEYDRRRGRAEHR